MGNFAGDLASCIILPVSLGVLAYGAFLETVAVRSIHNLSWERSFISILLSAALAGVPIIVSFILGVLLAVATT